MDNTDDSKETLKRDNEQNEENAAEQRQPETKRFAFQAPDNADNNKGCEITNPRKNDDTPTDEPTTSTEGETLPSAEKSVPNQSSQDEYAQHITYNEKGVAIYTDPITNAQHEFDKESNQWIPLKSNLASASESVATTSTDNPYENEHYRWCHESNKWILKETPSAPSAWNRQDFQTEFKDGVHTYTDNDGVVFFWDNEKNAWFPKIDDDFMAMYQLNYGFVDNTSGTQNKTETVPSSNQEANLVEGEKNYTLGGRRKPEAPKWFEVPPELNTKVYVSNLPLDITQDEFIEVMSKCGMIFRDPQTNKMKVKLYAEQDGQLKGDGLCHYIKPPCLRLF